MTTPIEQQQDLEKLARKIVELGFETPAMFLLESHRPMVSILRQFCIFFEPVVSPLFGLDRYTRLQDLLSSRENVDALVNLIETYSIAKNSKTKEK